jgi:hypothetical protein
VTTVVTIVLTAGGTDYVALSGALTIPSGNGSGTLVVSVEDTGNDPIVGISIMVPSGSDPTTDLCSATCPMQVIYNSSPVSPSNPIPGNNNASGVLTTNEGQTGYTYTIYFVVSFADGTTQSPSLPVTGQI